MRKEIPWTLGEQERGNEYKNGNTYFLLLNLFECNKDKKYSSSELVEKIRRCKAVVTIALTSLLKSKSIKIIGFEDRAYGNIAPIYQHIDGKVPELHIIEQDSKEYVKLNLITIRDFSKKKSGLPDSSKQTRLTCLVNEFKVPFYYAKTSRAYFKVYNKEDLKNLLSKNPKDIDKNKEVSFKFFKWVITIK